MNSTPTPGSSDEDEILSFLARVEKFLLRIIEGIVIFFVHRIPKWTYEVIRGCLEHLWEYVERFIRIVVRLGRVVGLMVVLAALVIGPGVALSYANAPWALVIWVGLIVGALLFALQHYVRKEYERRKRERAAQPSRRLVCGECRTAHAGPKAPIKCDHCGAEWRGVEV
jgi:hypothetical protein